MAATTPCIGEGVLVVKTKEGQEILRLSFKNEVKDLISHYELMQSQNLVVEGDSKAAVDFVGWCSILMMKKLLNRELK